jgi:DNA (cytosine-5)-methyltransferase 1
MVPEFFRAVSDLQPDAFCMENVPALGNAKFSNYLDEQVQRKLRNSYHWRKFYMFAPHFGVPQRRERLFVVGFKSKPCFDRFEIPKPTHLITKFSGEANRSLKKFLSIYDKLPDTRDLPQTMGVRQAIGLDNEFPDGLAPTFRSGFTGPRNSTSILNGASSQRVFAEMGVWGNGVAPSIAEAEAFIPENGHTRLSVADCALIQGFPSNWEICGPVYKAIGQIGNSVAPPVAYAVAKAIKEALMQ